MTGNMIASLAVVIFVMLAVARAQQAASALGNLDVNVNIAGTNFNIQFAPERDSVDSIATNLCAQHAGTIGVTQETLPQCVGSVTQYLRNAVAEWSLDRTLEVPINLQGNRFDISFMPEIQPASTMANQLCRQHAAVLGVDENNLPQCVNPVTDYLQSAVRRWAAEKTLEVSVPIEQNVFQLSFMPERRSAESMATQLCVDNAQMLGVTQETLSGCISPVMQYLQGAINDWVTSKTVVVDMNLNNKPYTMRFMPERVTAQEMGQRLCTEQAAELGLTTQEQLVNECIAPVASYVQNEINSWLQSKTLVVPLTVQGADNQPQTAQVSFLPEHETAISVARNFCVQNAQALGLTNENVVQRCLNPVNDYLQTEVNKWKASRM